MKCNSVTHKRDSNATEKRSHFSGTLKHFEENGEENGDRRTYARRDYISFTEAEHKTHFRLFFFA